MGKRLTTQEFISKAKEIHGNKYDYSKVIYKNNRTAVEIFCKSCNSSFWQKPDGHSNDKNGCPKCYGNKIQTTQTWIIEAVAIHGDKYDYSKVVYERALDKVEIICKKHNVSFWQKPNHHISSKSGCPACGGSKLTQELFLAKANEAHNFKYQYPDLQYIGYEGKIKIKCPNINHQRSCIWYE